MRGNYFSQSLAADKGLSEKGRENGFSPLFSLCNPLGNRLLGALKTAPLPEILSLSPPRGARERERELGGAGRSRTPCWENLRECRKMAEKGRGCPAGRVRARAPFTAMPETETPEPETPPQPETPPPAGDPPPAASVVSSGRLREETLAAELDAEREANRLAQIRIAELEDETHQLRLVTPRAPRSQIRDWLAGSTFFHR